MVLSLSSVSCSVTKDVPGLVSVSVGCPDCSLSACSASSVFFFSPLIITHLSLKSSSPSSITTSESESGLIHNMTVFLLGQYLLIFVAL